MPLSYYHNAYAKCDFNRITASHRDEIMEETHIKVKHETKNDELVYKAQNLTGYLSK